MYLVDCARANGDRNPLAQCLVHSQLSVNVNYHHRYIGLFIGQVALQELGMQRQLEHSPQ